MPFAHVESLVYDGVVYDVADELHYPGFEDLYIWLLLRSPAGVELILEEFQGSYSLFLPDDSIVGFEPVHEYSLAFGSVTETPSWLAQNLLCAHGSDGTPTKIADRIFAVQPVEIGDDGVLYPDGRSRLLRPVVSDAQMLANIFLYGINASYGPVIEISTGAPVVVVGGDAVVVAGDRLAVEEIRDVMGRPEFLVASAHDRGWVDAFDVATSVVSAENGYFIVDEVGATQGFHVLLHRDFTWSLESYPDSEVDPDTTIVVE